METKEEKLKKKCEDKEDELEKIKIEYQATVLDLNGLVLEAD